MRPRRTLIAAAIAAALVAGTVPPAAAVPVTDFEMPFPCAQAWTGSTRSTHSPSQNAVDWNRTDDVDDPVIASAAGRVVTADSVADSGYGRWVMVDHANGERSLYAHLNVVMVAAGQWVDQGQQIGTLGSTGNSASPHLHYEQRVGSGVTAPYFHQAAYRFGAGLTSVNCVDVPLTGDWDGNGVAQTTVFRRGARAQWTYERPGATPMSVYFGLNTDQPVAGDWNGDGRDELGVRRPANRTFYLRTPTGTQMVVLGAVDDQPVAGNWGGDARWEVGVWSPSRAAFSLRMPDGTLSLVRLGTTDDLPVTGDWDGNGITDLGVFDPTTATWTLRTVDRSGIGWSASVRHGRPRDLPVTGDWDGDGVTDLGSWTPATAQLAQRRPSPNGGSPTLTYVRFGATR